MRTSLKIQAFSAHPRREEMATDSPADPPHPSTSGLSVSALGLNCRQASQPLSGWWGAGGLQQASPTPPRAPCTLGCEESLLQGALKAKLLASLSSMPWRPSQPKSSLPSWPGLFRLWSCCTLSLRALRLLFFMFFKRCCTYIGRRKSHNSKR